MYNDVILAVNIWHSSTV